MSSRTLVGVCAYGGLKFLEIGLNAIRESAAGVDVLVIVAKPGDTEMHNFLDAFEERNRFENMRLHVMGHPSNEGFPAAVNDMYDWAFVREDYGGLYDNLIIMGNDVVPMPGAIEAMIRCADTTDYEMVCGSEFNARFLYDHYPEARKFFRGDDLIFTDWGARPWLLHHDGQTGVEPDTRKDIRNLTLFKRSSFEKVGYDDVNFWPNGYFADNDYGRRCDLLNVKACGLKEAAFFHFTSRTLKQGEKRPHDTYFERNRIYYTHKWGGDVGHEKYFIPFNGGPYSLGEVEIPLEMKIGTRERESRCIARWAYL